jgi:hypothetical protein
MSSPKRNFWIAYYALGALAIVSATALTACSPSAATPEHETQSAALTISPGVTLTSATWWLIAPDGTTTTGTVSVGSTKIVSVPTSALNLAPSTTYQLIVSGVASDGVTGCSGSKTFTSAATMTQPAPIAVTLACAGPPDAGQALVTTNVNSCPVIDGVSANPASANVGQTMALEMTAHDPDSGPAVLTFHWFSDGGTLTGTTTASATFTCTQPGTVTLTAAASDGDPGCGVSLPFTVACTEP